jgi:hypothetical protein
MSGVQQKTVKLPFKLSAQVKGVQKAYGRFVQQYGQGEGTRIFLAKAKEQGKGKTIRQKVISVYKKGAKLN